MPQPELLKRVVRVLEQAQIEYMLTGSQASSLQGEPRSTHDIDLVVDLSDSAVALLTSEFTPPDFYLSADSIRDAIRLRSMFNLLDVMEGDKVDFWLLTDEPFDRCRFSRRITTTFQGVPIKISSREDTVLAKLRWAKMCGGSEKQFGDAMSIFEMWHGQLDLEYLETWAARLEIEDLWLQLKAQADPLDEESE